MQKNDISLPEKSEQLYSGSVKKCHVCKRLILKEKVLCPWCETEQKCYG